MPTLTRIGPVLALIGIFLPDPKLAGYSSSAARTERDWEQQFQALPVPDTMRANMKRLSARPHHVGTLYDKDNAEWILARFKSFGLDAHIENFDVLYPTPRERLVEMVAPTPLRLSLKESALAVDPTSQQTTEQLPSYNVYSVDGDVTAPLVYVNFGVPADYDELAAHGVSVKGAIVIARYGGSWRGIKPKVAAEHGAVGCLIYSDPHEDGYAVGEVYPNGPMRPRDGVQRGSVMDMPTYPGDPLTPGIGATRGAKRLPLSEVKTLTKIPVLPISYGDAQPLLAALKGPIAPAAWRGSLPITYRMGPGPTKVHLVLKSDWGTKTLYDVVARIPGSVAPDEWVIRGNHHDAWVNGAADPLSGQASLIEEARGYGQLLAKGWKPRRTIIYCAWDGEEPGLLGSTEWAETHADELQQHAVAYLNTDTNDRGFLSIEGSHILEAFFNDIAKGIRDPETHQSVWRRMQAEAVRQGPQAQRDSIRARPDLRIGALGSGSDYSAFIQHLGIASANLGYGGESPSSGVYHSIYDDFYWYTHFGDTSFVYERALAQTIGTAVMRLSDAEIIPFDYAGLAETVQKYRTELVKLAKDETDSLLEQNHEIRDGVFAEVSDPLHPTFAPDSAQTPPHLVFTPLENGANALTRAAADYSAAAAAVDSDGGAGLDRASPQTLAAVNAMLIKSERVLLSPDGLPNRPWYRHLLYAPGFYTGYGVKTVPGVREAIEQKEWDLADHEIGRVGKVLDDEAALVTQAAAALRGIKQ
jgi:N-acetylated-alpha-linked acidic dipeptidase